jgi:hypothetical protein
MYVDLDKNVKGISTIPTDIVITNQRPDLVCIDRCNKCIYILELTVPFETNFENAHQYKCQRYSSLITDSAPASRIF